MDEKSALTSIKTAWIFGLICSGITTIVIILSFFGINIMGINIFSIIDVLATLGLSFGIYKKSRVCAIILFIYYILGRIELSANYGSSAGAVSIIVFGLIYFNGIRGTFYYHKHKDEESKSQASV